MTTFDPSVLDFRSSRFADLCGSVTKYELTDKQKIDLNNLEKINKVLTFNQAWDYAYLTKKRDAKPELDDTGKTWVQQLFREYIRSTYTPGFSSKETEKGHIVEQEAIDLAARVFDWGPTIKSSKEFKDKIGTGHPDVWKPLVRARADVKSSWWDKTFPLFDPELKNKTYVWQAKRYCMQGEVDDWWIIYCLINTPEPLVIRQAQELWKESGESGYLMRGNEFVSPTAEQFYDQVKTLHTFDHLADWERVKPFKVILTKEDIDFAKKRDQMAREYAMTLFEEYKEHKSFIKSLKRA